MNDLPVQSYIVGLVSPALNRDRLLFLAAVGFEDGGAGPDEWFLCMVGSGSGLFNHPGLW